MHLIRLLRSIKIEERAEQGRLTGKMEKKRPVVLAGAPETEGIQAVGGISSWQQVVDEREGETTEMPEGGRLCSAVRRREGLSPEVVAGSRKSGA